MKKWTCNACGKTNPVGTVCTCDPEKDVREELEGITYPSLGALAFITIAEDGTKWTDAKQKSLVHINEELINAILKRFKLERRNGKK